MTAEKEYELEEVCEILNKPDSYAGYLRKLCNEKKIAGRKVPWKTRTKWVIPQEALDRLLNKVQNVSYSALEAEWTKAQRTGLLTGRIISPRGVEANLYGISKFWEYLRGIAFDTRKKANNIVDLKGSIVTENTTQEAFEKRLARTVDDITIANLRQALANVPIDQAARNCHFSQRDQIYKGFISIYKLLVEKGLRNEADFQAIKKIKPRRVFPERKTFLHENQLQKLIETNDISLNGRTTFDQALTRTMIFLMAFGGLRRAEVMGLLLQDIDLENGWLQFMAKGNKLQEIPIYSELGQQLRDWLINYRPTKETTAENALIQSNGEPLTRDVINKRIKKLGQKIGEDITPHGLRRTCATFFASKGMPPALISELLGHSAGSTTDKYIMSTKRQLYAFMNDTVGETQVSNQGKRRLTKEEKLAKLDREEY